MSFGTRGERPVLRSDSTYRIERWDQQSQRYVTFFDSLDTYHELMQTVEQIQKNRVTAVPDDFRIVEIEKREYVLDIFQNRKATTPTP
jgi:hypothetical protein